MLQTLEISVALQWATEIFGLTNVPRYYMSPKNFLTAYRDGDSYSFVVKDDQFYGHTYGDNPHLDERWQKVAVSGINPPSIFDCKPGNGFEFWAINTAETGAPLEVISDYALINSILDEHAPDLSVRPGGDEEIFWGAIRNQSGEIASLGALVQWKSKQFVLASVVTRSEDRGRGLATALSAGVANHAHSLGISEVGLGVTNTNIAAQRAYEKAGYRRLAAFTNYFRE
jgi:ribosomal protein S18 acetylase RimI-like enzyme